MAWPYGDWLCTRAEGKGFTEGKVYKCKKDNTGGPRIYPYEGSSWSPYWSKFKGRFVDDRFRFKYIGDTLMKYETGCWHNWDGKGTCPFDKDKANYYIAVVDTSGSGYWEPEVSRGVEVTKDGHARWEYTSDQCFRQVVAFYIVSYNEPKEMTVAEIEKELGYSVKVVK